MRLLILGGTSFVGRHLTDAALAAGHAVTHLNRGVSAAADPTAAWPDVQTLPADRDDPASLSVLGDQEWDAVLDVSGLTAARVAATARAVRDQVDRYLLISTISVYADGPDVIDETAPTLPGDADDPDAPSMARYGEQKRGAELAALRTFGEDRVTLLRPGVILGPYENVGRVSYWLGRAAGDGPFIAPGDPERPFEFVDARDLAGFAVSLIQRGRTGTYTCLNPAGRDTWGDWVAACCWAAGSEAEPVWVPDDVLLAAGVRPWGGLPMWRPDTGPQYVTDAARAAGLADRPLGETVEDSWTWLRALDAPPPALYRGPSLARADELAILEKYAAAP